MSKGDTLTSRQLEENSCEIIPEKLYLTSFDNPPLRNEDTYCFSIDDTIRYQNYCLDFGPLDLGQTVRFCELLNTILQTENGKGKKVFFYSSTSKEFCSNAAVLIGAWLVLYHNKSSSEAYALVENRADTFENFHDASFFFCKYMVKVRDCFDGLEHARNLNFFSWPQFNYAEYEHYAEHLDLHWLVEGKFCAFAGPFQQRKEFGNGYMSTTPNDFVQYFKEKNVSAVIRLNKKQYEASEFTKHGINHYDLFYQDGGLPPEHILERFIKICEEEKGAIAVHCKAGLGRTGTCIAMYLMKHFDISARELLGWFRVVRPGSVIGPQQEYLVRHENAMRVKGKQQLKQKQVKRSSALQHDKTRSYTSLNQVDRNELERVLDEEKYVAEDEHGETQGDQLNRMKAEHRRKGQ